MRVFLSCVSGQLGDCRAALATDLRAIGCEVRVQEDFQQGPRTLIERLQEYVDGCDRVIALIGDAYGSEAAGPVPAGVAPPRSYTQWELLFALGERLDGSRVPARDVQLYFASDGFLAARPAAQTEEHAERQRLFRREIEATGKHWGRFESVDGLCRLVLRDGWKMNDRPHRPNNLPYTSLGTLFKGRDEIVDLIRRKLASGRHAAAIRPRQLIHGLGGVGKTRLAVEYAWRHASDYAALLFVTADSPAGLGRNLAALCGPGILNLPERDATAEEVEVAAALRWLDTHPGWFLILDNVDSPEAAASVEKLLARLYGGHVLITSRLADWSGGVEPLELDVLREEDAADFLIERTEARRAKSGDDRADAVQLAREVGGLALALEQAGAFINQKRCSIAAYLQRWRERERGVREWFDGRLMSYPRSVAVTWDTTVDQLDAPALGLLRFLSFLSPDPIPRFLVQERAGEALPIPDGHRPTERLRESIARVHAAGERPVAEPAVNLEDALAALASWSLVKLEPDGRSFRVHRLVQEVTRERLPPGERVEWLAIALRWLSDCLPGDADDVRTWPVWDPLRAHVTFTIAVANEVRLTDPTVRMMNDLAVLLMVKALHREAEPLMRRTLAIDEEVLGPDHPNVAIRLNNLALLLQGTNRHGDAESLLRRALAITEKVLGSNHSNIAIRLANLALLLLRTGRRGEAEPLMRRALAIDEEIFGPNSSKVAVHLNNLALLLQDTNRHGDAEPLMRRSLAIAEEVFGPNHPNVADRLNNLAQLLQSAARWGEAEPLMRRALAIDEEVFGPSHPSGARDLNNLARLLQDTNRLGEAEPLMRRQLVIFLQFTRAAGHEHPHLRASGRNYFALLRQSGLDEAAGWARVNEVGVEFGVRFGE